MPEMWKVRVDTDGDKEEEQELGQFEKEVVCEDDEVDEEEEDAYNLTSFYQENKKSPTELG